ncbi:hypothetical protein BCAR13_390021 [Paraburkholderia caribensis]|nr:hypothetical protein BCAR13_390021 [Paraburkholderia caribensis]
MGRKKSAWSSFIPRPKQSCNCMLYEHGRCGMTDSRRATARDQADVKAETTTSGEKTVCGSTERADLLLEWVGV